MCQKSVLNLQGSFKLITIYVKNIIRKHDNFQFVKVLAKIGAKAARLIATEFDPPSMSRIQLVWTHFQGTQGDEDDDDDDDDGDEDKYDDHCDEDEDHNTAT